MYRCAVCDDNGADAAFVVSLIDKWNQENGNERAIYKTEVFPSAEAFLFAYEENQEYDILLLDIEMGGMSGVELAKRLRQMGAGLQIIFITGYMDYISEGYDVEALHYLIKPVTGEKLGEVLDRAMERIKTRERGLVLTLPDGIVRVPL